MLPKEATAFASADHGFRLPRGTLAVLGLLAALGLIAEGAIYDWSVLYLQQELGSPQQQAALAYASFSAAMAHGALRRRCDAGTLRAGRAAARAARCWRPRR